MSLANVTSNLGLLGFALSSVVYLLAVQRSRGVQTAGAGSLQQGAQAAAFGLFALATVLVSVALAAVAGTASLLDVSGVLLTCAIGWIATLGHLKFNLRLIGAFVAPMATLILLIQFFVGPAPGSAAAQPATADSLMVKVHVGLAILGQAFAIIACAISVLYLWQQNLLKKKLLDQLPQNLPAIDRLDFLLMLSLWSGFVFITLGLLTGAVYSQLYVVPAEMRLGYKILWAILVWVWYLATLLARNVFNRPSKRIAQMALAGFVLLALSYFGMGFFRPLGG